MSFSITSRNNKNLQVSVCSFNKSPKRNRLIIRNVNMGEIHRGLTFHHIQAKDNKEKEKKISPHKQTKNEIISLIEKTKLLIHAQNYEGRDETDRPMTVRNFGNAFKNRITQTSHTNRYRPCGVQNMSRSVNLDLKKSDKMDNIFESAIHKSSIKRVDGYTSHDPRVLTIRLVRNSKTRESKRKVPMNNIMRPTSQGIHSKRISQILEPW